MCTRPNHEAKTMIQHCHLLPNWSDCIQIHTYSVILNITHASTIIRSQTATPQTSLLMWSLGLKSIPVHRMTDVACPFYYSKYANTIMKRHFAKIVNQPRRLLYTAFLLIRKNWPSMQIGSGVMLGQVNKSTTSYLPSSEWIGIFFMLWCCLAVRLIQILWQIALSTVTLASYIRRGVCFVACICLFLHNRCILGLPTKPCHLCYHLVGSKRSPAAKFA